MSPKVVFLVILCALSTLVSAQDINLGFADEGDRQIWFGSALPNQPPGDTDGIRTTKAEATVPIGDKKDSDLVYVWDRKSGNVASKSVKDAKSAVWTLKAEDYKDIGQVSVKVEHAGKPVAGALVDLDDGKRKSAQLLEPSSHGMVSFFGVKPGSLKLTVHYKVSGKDASPITQLLDAKLARTDPTLTATISLAEDVETVGGATPTTTQPKSGATPTDKPSSDKESSGGIAGVFGKILIYFIALAAMVAAVYYAMMYAKKNPDSLGSKLEQLGVQIPKPGDDPLMDASQIPAPIRSTPAPVQKIILDDSAPDPISPIGSSPMASPSTFGSRGEPCLVSQSGDAMPLPEGDLVVGREVGLGLSLVGESTVSRKHAQITRNGSQVMVLDFGSTNGTFVNGVQVQGEKQLQSGDSVQFGSVRFRYES